MTGFLWDFASFIVALGVLVSVHEYGHFWVARRCGVKVEKFSIGFGKSLWSRVGKDGTEYSVCVIPLGGYVKMLDGRIDDLTEEQKPFAFDHKTLWQRTAIVAAGPIFNFLLAIVAYWLVFIIGVPTVKPVIGQIAPSSIAAQAGLQSGMELKAISGVKTADWESVNMRLISHIGDKSLTMTVSPKNDIGVVETKTLDLASWHFDPEKESAMQALGITPYSPKVLLTLSNVVKGGAGEKSGLQAGDTLVSLNGKALNNWQQVVKGIQGSPNQQVKLTVERKGKMVDISLLPGQKTLSNGKVIGFAGIVPSAEPWPEDYKIDLKYGVVDSVGKAIEKTGQVIALTASVLKKLIVGDIGLNNLSGPISIAKGAGTTAEHGLVYFLGFLALISVNLGIINLVPLPMLDGGHLLFFAIEAVIRRPVSEKVQEMGYRVGGAIIFSLMALAIFNDFTRL
ncbi:sigma E protease regulator RseP [Vibrio sp. S4M6]|uniref:sigma E protease regulator RseP n=1 Tax=Vibrio sinus TaxID=2946865 RepID=UPI00202AC02F|nr:sigma E protease regulator RseP [Vibrio sinus]MCL9782167.1 sigma E protease regulator RseP [Vibrio sinus]